MSNAPKIERIELSRYRTPTHDLATDASWAMGQFYQPGAKGNRGRVGIKIHTDIGVTGEYITGTPATYEQITMIAYLLVGRSALEREWFYNQAKSTLRKHDRMGVGPVDVAIVGPSPGNTTMLRYTNCWADIARGSHAMPAPTTPTANPTV